MRIGELTRSGFRSAPPTDLDALREHFSTRHYIRLDSLVEAWLLDAWARAIDTAPFRVRVHHDAAYWGGKTPPEDQVIDASNVLGRMLFAMNDPAFFQSVEHVTGCGPIGCFHGIVYRLGAGVGNRDRFHSDMNGNRLAALSINLGREAHAGGRLEIAEAEGGRMVGEVDNTVFGGAVLFQLAESLRHRVGDVEPGPVRTVFTGWFQERPAYADWLRGATAKGLVR